MSKNEGARHNAGKLRWQLIPWDAVRAIVEILEMGATKYAPRNWENGLSWSETFDSLQRHLLAWYGGEDRDKESGKLHLAHVGCNALFLIAFTLRGTGKDDRPVTIKHPEPKINGVTELAPEGNIRSVPRRPDQRNPDKWLFVPQPGGSPFRSPDVAQHPDLPGVEIVRYHNTKCGYQYYVRAVGGAPDNTRHTKHRSLNDAINDAIMLHHRRRAWRRSPDDDTIGTKRYVSEAWPERQVEYFESAPTGCRKWAVTPSTLPGKWYPGSTWCDSFGDACKLAQELAEEDRNVTV